MQNFKEWLNNRDPEMLNEIKKPFKNFNKEKNHPEGGLKPSYAKKLGMNNDTINSLIDATLAELEKP